MSEPQQGFTLDRIIGTSDALVQTLGSARRVAQASTSTVLIIGETGTGKELFARGIHYEGVHAAAPFVAINCAAIPDTLLESELFGHEAGAFTGATVRKVGLMELAGNGTLFLDEVHQLPIQAQPKLLRALEARHVRRLGGTQEIAIDCRIIAASNVSIERAVEEETFRDDLFYRLNVLRIDIPPLRERRGDVPILARHFVREMCREHRRGEKELTTQALSLLAEHRWPGNVRELKNVIERATVLSGASGAITPAHLAIKHRVPRLAVSSGAALAGEIEVPMEGKSMRAIEREAVMLTLRATDGNQSQAAKMLGISRPTLAKLVREQEPSAS
ncbi:MAG: sigma 54-interacting transcriptional regulator [Gemmatimonadota bacterium]